MDRVGAARGGALRDRRGEPVDVALPERIRGVGLGDDGRADGRSAERVRALPDGGLPPGSAALRLPGAAPRRRSGQRLRRHLPVRDRLPGAAAALRGRRRGGGALRDPRRRAGAARARFDPRLRRVVAREPVRHAAARVSDRQRRLPMGRDDDHRRHRRLARRQAGPRDVPVAGAGGGGGTAARRARPARRRPRRRDPLRPRAQLVARTGCGLRGVHPRAARGRAVRPDGDRPRRGGRSAGDGGRRSRRRRRLLARVPAADGRHAAGADPEDRPGGLPGGHGRAEVLGGERLPRARPTLADRGAVAAGAPDGGDGLARPARARCLLLAGARARGPPRPAGGERRSEHPRLRGRAKHRRGTPPALGPPG